MARDTRAAFLRALEKLEPGIARAFREAIQDIRSTAQRREINRAIKRAVETGDVGWGVVEVLSAIQSSEEFFAPVDRALREAFEGGANYLIDTIPKTSIPGVGPFIVRFQGRHPRAEAWTRRRAAALITEIAEDTRKMIRETIAEAVEQSLPYRSVTRALIGRTEGNQLKGGMIGLHSRQAEAVRAARRDLEALDAAYFRRARRDKRFDRAVRKAMQEGRALSQAEIEKITGRYADRLLRLRGETIARTEGNRAMNAGRAEGIEQMIESGKVPASAVTKMWDATPDRFTRDSHAALNGVEIAWGQKFVSPVTGVTLNWPHDENAPAEETINCRCSCRFRVDWASLAR